MIDKSRLLAFAILLLHFVEAQSCLAQDIFNAGDGSAGRGGGVGFSGGGTSFSGSGGTRYGSRNPAMALPDSAFLDPDVILGSDRTPCKYAIKASHLVLTDMSTPIWYDVTPSGKVLNPECRRGLELKPKVFQVANEGSPPEIKAQLQRLHQRVMAAFQTAVAQGQDKIDEREYATIATGREEVYANLIYPFCMREQQPSYKAGLEQSGSTTGGTMRGGASGSGTFANSNANASSSKFTGNVSEQEVCYVIDWEPWKKRVGEILDHPELQALIKRVQRGFRVRIDLVFAENGGLISCYTTYDFGNNPPIPEPGLLSIEDARVQVDNLVKRIIRSNGTRYAFPPSLEFRNEMRSKGKLKTTQGRYLTWERKREYGTGWSRNTKPDENLNEVLHFNSGEKVPMGCVPCAQANNLVAPEARVLYGNNGSIPPSGGYTNPPQYGNQINPPQNGNSYPPPGNQPTAPWSPRKHWGINPGDGQNNSPTRFNNGSYNPFEKPRNTPADNF